MLYYSKNNQFRLYLIVVVALQIPPPPFRARFRVMNWLTTIVALLLFRLRSRKFRTNSPKMVTPTLETLHCPSSFTLRSDVGFLLSFLVDTDVVRMCPHDPTWVPLQSLHHLGLFHQYRKLSNPQRYEESSQLMVQTALKFSTAPFFGDSLRVEPRQVLEPVSICLYRHSPLLQGKELCFPLISGIVRKVFLQESCPEVSPSHLLFTGVH